MAEDKPLSHWLTTFFGAESPLHLSLRSVPWVDDFQRSHNSLTLKQVLSQPENYKPINGP